MGYTLRRQSNRTLFSSSGQDFLMVFSVSEAFFSQLLQCSALHVSLNASCYVLVKACVHVRCPPSVCISHLSLSGPFFFFFVFDLLIPLHPLSSNWRRMRLLKISGATCAMERCREIRETLALHLIFSSAILCLFVEWLGKIPVGLH